MPPACRISSTTVCADECASTPDCRAGYTCDLEEHVCRQACSSDAECNLVVRDGNIASEAGPWTCNPTTGRCEHGGTSGAVAGDACTADSDCMANGTCFTEDFGGGTAGFCARNGCTAGFECGGGEECSLRGNPWSGSWCLPACTVGAEPESDVLGIDGHGLGCAVGHSCHWAGVDASPSGGCFPGNYNAVATPNVGGACQSAADCYSPFGYGNCLFEALTDIGSGMCSVQSCSPVATGILPNVTTTTRVCDPVAEICVGFASQQSQCLSRCTSAASCAPGYACNDSILSGGLGVCWPNCQENGDCRVGVTCIDNANPAVTCDADGPDNTPNTFDDPSCYCADRTTR